MSQHQNQSRHSVRRIVLPSGRSVEVVRFDVESCTDESVGLHVCPACGSELVQPIEWGEMSDDRWELTLHCPNCDWARRDIYDHDRVMQLEERLDDGVAAILGDLRRLASANMADEIDRFASALQADLILPEDF
jgi:predicted RNA-binding Zn-ribbon protein involved in translation (DUF1610 family)